jgi:cation:H+ antiporter
VLGLLHLALAAVFLAVGADVYTSRVRALAARLQVTAIAIALLLAGAEPEELVTAVIASSQHKPGIAAGDAVGANLTMLTLVLGALAVLQPLPLTSRIRPYLLAACATTLLAASVMTGGGTVSRAEGALLLALYVVFAATVLVREHRRARNEPRPLDPSSGSVHALLAFAGLGIVTLGGWLAVSGASRVVSSLGFAESAVGLTLVAFATSAELLALIWAARRHAVSELALVALVGSVVGNATATLGAGAVVRPLSTTGVVAAAWVAAALSALLLLEPIWTAPRARLTGAGLVVGYVAYVAIVL